MHMAMEAKPHLTVLDASVVVEAKGLRATDRSMPRDVVDLDCIANDGRHFVIDAVMTTIYRNTMLNNVAMIPGYAANHAEGIQFLADMTLRQPIAVPHGDPHVVVPFAI
jgi:hypothetical protein